MVGPDLMLFIQWVEIPPGGELMRNSKDVTVCGKQFEGIPNRDSTKYKSLYGIHSVRTLLRGSLRYKGYADILYGLKQLGLIDGEDHPRLQKDSAQVTWRDVLAMLIAKSDVRRASLEEAVLQALQGKADVFQAIKELGLLSDTPVVCRETPVDTLAAHLTPLLEYKHGERDMIVLQHDIDIRYPNHKKVRRTISLEAFGHPADGHSAMALTVGLPVAMAARLILEEKIKGPGLLFPLTRDVYGPLLRELRASSKDWATWMESSCDID
jgi:alpha-aminoadipic semialdehyde synthase